MEKELIKTISLSLLLLLIVSSFIVPVIKSKYENSIEDNLVMEIVDNGIIYLNYIVCDDVNKTRLLENNQSEYLDYVEEACIGEKIAVNIIDIETYNTEIASLFINENVDELRGAICQNSGESI